jgi:hypothetical protein
LKALVAGMGVLIVLGTALVIGVVIHRLYARNSAPSMTAATLPPATGVLALPAGAHITALAAAGGTFAVSVSGPSGEQLWLIDPETGGRRLVITAPK